MGLSVFGYKLVHKRKLAAKAAELPVELDDADRAAIAAARPFTMTSVERLAALVKAVRYIAANGIAGSIVECGVWKGGSMVCAARTLLNVGDAGRDLYLFDTFEGMPAPTEHDRSHHGHAASDLLRDDREDGLIRAVGPLEVVKGAMGATGYSASRVHYVQGKVEDTVPAGAPERIALLRLDTDWYESTRHELEHLYPRLVPGGVLIIDDYGHWQGARRAVEEYFAKVRPVPLMNVIDYTGRIAIKPG
jgi:hypothetical protein